jgi:hypothetical protein
VRRLAGSSLTFIVPRMASADQRQRPLSPSTPSLGLSLALSSARSLSLSLSLSRALSRCHFLPPSLFLSLSLSIYLSPSAGDCVSLLTRQLISISLHTNRRGTLCFYLCPHLLWVERTRSLCRAFSGSVSQNPRNRVSQLSSMSCHRASLTHSISGMVKVDGREFG